MISVWRTKMRKKKIAIHLKHNIPGTCKIVEALWYEDEFSVHGIELWLKMKLNQLVWNFLHFL